MDLRSRESLHTPVRASGGSRSPGLCEMPGGPLGAEVMAPSVNASRAESCPVAAVPSGKGSDTNVRDCSPSVKPLCQRVQDLNSLMMTTGLYFIEKQRHYFANKGPSSQGYGFSSSHVWM